MPAVSPSELAKLVTLRRKLLIVELDAALLMGRADTAGSIRAEMRSLELFPYDAAMVRVAPGRLAEPTSKQAGFDAQMEAARARVRELGHELQRVREQRKAVRR